MSFLDTKRGPWAPPEVSLIEEVCASLWERKGKRLRGHLVYWIGELCGREAGELDLYAWAAEAIHTASLLHDDVVDRASLRRGGPAANELFDNTLPVISGDYLFSDALHQVAVHGHGALLKSLCRTVKDLSQGECLQYDLRWRVPDSPRVFDDIARLKTASLLVWAASVGPVLAESPLLAPVTAFMEVFGRLFQFSDDWLDITGTAGKGQWTDLREGKINSATWRLLKGSPDLETAVRTAFSRREVPDAILVAFAREAQRGGARSVRDALEALVAQGDAIAKRLPEGPVRKTLGGLLRVCVERGY